MAEQLWHSWGSSRDSWKEIDFNGDYFSMDRPLSNNLTVAEVVCTPNTSYNHWTLVGMPDQVTNDLIRIAATGDCDGLDFLPPKTRESAENVSRDSPPALRSRDTWYRQRMPRALDRDCFAAAASRPYTRLENVAETSREDFELDQ